MTKRQKTVLARIVAGLVLFAAGMIIPLDSTVKIIYFGIIYLLSGYDVLLKAVKNIFRGDVFDENFLMCIASIGAFVIGEYPEGVAVMLFYQIGELFQSIAVAKSRKSITELMDLRPDYANRLIGEKIEVVDPDEVAVGDIIIIKPGEKIPLDGVVTSGESYLDTAALTGESVPRRCVTGDEIMSGCVNGGGTLTVEVKKLFGESTAAKILDMVENAAAKKTKAENFITKFARYYTPAVVFAAVLLAVVPPLVLAQPFSEWIHRALIFLVVSCPCALVISVPLTFFAGIGGASKNGILIKGSNYFEALSKARTVVFDKTGTLTKGEFSVSSIEPVGISESELLETAACAEALSSHPIAVSIREACGKKTIMADNISEIAGKGTRAEINGEIILAGNRSLLQNENIAVDEDECDGTVVYVARGGRYLGKIVISDTVKPDAADCINGLRAAGVTTVMLTGDNEKTAGIVAAEIGIDKYFAGLLPGDKVEHVEQLINENNGSLIFVGDGINDAPVLSRADIGIAMGGIGSDAATEAADVVIMNDEPSAVMMAVKIARKTMRIARQNIVFALAVKMIILILGAAGIAGMWAAVFADVGVSVIAIFNAIRAIKQ